MNKTSHNRINLFMPAAVVATVAVPAVFTTKFHVDMFDKTQPVQRQKMKNKMIGFWSGFSLGAIAIHKALRKSNGAKIASVIFATASSWLGLETAKFYNKNFLNTKNKYTKSLVIKNKTFA